MSKKIIDALAPYFERDTRVEFVPMRDETNAGHSSRLHPKFRTPEDYDRVAVNSNFHDKNQLHAALIHELGHGLEEQIAKVVEEQGLKALPAELDSDYADFYADLIPCYILDPEALKAHGDDPLVKDTIAAIRKTLGENDFSELREALTAMAAAHASELEKEGAVREPAESPFYLRVFEKIEEYKRRHP